MHQFSSPSKNHFEHFSLLYVSCVFLLHANVLRNIHAENTFLTSIFLAFHFHVTFLFQITNFENWYFLKYCGSMVILSD